MKILDAGTVQLTNTDVLLWIRSKRAQHEAREAAAAAASSRRGRASAHGPANYMRALRNHESVLASTIYPYTTNPDAYESYEAGMQKLEDLIFERVVSHVAPPETVKTVKQKKAFLGTKCLSQSEFLMVHNLAPKTMEQLTAVLDRAEDRWTPEELETLLGCIWEVYRYNEQRPA
ncbi:hypothetical protein K470DRAFT_273700 [Piedraia hortae CBS 480.64]|uniref:DNA-directed RNA polymerase III subunit RPC9 n=1 Tax=Piedraia hortae CBS 480.64 TaxID=1314780 RepID=A0A6A7CBN7_9PEZI|nr:hypothetical protein K470DRAFT_273700 [Piedraia hortae CBS 480.64]